MTKFNFRLLYPFGLCLFFFVIVVFKLNAQSCLRGVVLFSAQEGHAKQLILKSDFPPADIYANDLNFTRSKMPADQGKLAEIALMIKSQL